MDGTHLCGGTTSTGTPLWHIALQTPTAKIRPHYQFSVGCSSKIHWNSLDTMPYHNLSYRLSIWLLIHIVLYRIVWCQCHIVSVSRHIVWCQCRVVSVSRHIVWCQCRIASVSYHIVSYPGGVVSCQCCIASCRIMSVWHRAVSYHIVIMSYHIVSYHIVSYHCYLYHIMACRIAPSMLSEYCKCRCHNLKNK